MTTGELSIVSVRAVVSNRAEVADDAMRLSHDVYVERGFLAPVASGHRFLAAYLNPGTRFIVLYSADEPIATATVVPDGPFGLPADRSFAEEIDEVRTSTQTRSEVTGLSVAPLWRRRSRTLLGLLLGTIVRVTGRRQPGHRVVYVVEPRQARLMGSMLLGERTVGPRPLYGAPGTMIITCDMSRWRSYYDTASRSATRDVVARYVLDREPGWLVDEPPSDGWHALLSDPVDLTDLRTRLHRQVDLVRAAMGSSRATSLP